MNAESYNEDPDLESIRSSGEGAPADEREADALLDAFEIAITDTHFVPSQGAENAKGRFRAMLRARLLARPSLEEPAPTVSQEAPTAAEIIAWLRGRPGTSWIATIQDIETAVAALHAASGGIPRTDSEEPKRDTWARQHFPNGVDLRSSESTLSEEERQWLEAVRSHLVDQSFVMHRNEIKLMVRIIDRLQRVPSPKGSGPDLGRAGLEQLVALDSEQRRDARAAKGSEEGKR